MPGTSARYHPDDLHPQMARRLPELTNIRLVTHDRGAPHSDAWLSSTTSSRSLQRHNTKGFSTQGISFRRYGIDPKRLVYQNAPWKLNSEAGGFEGWNSSWRCTTGKLV
jgi:hypothetical protein